MTLRTARPVLPPELILQVMSWLRNDDQTLSNCALSSWTTIYPSRSVQFLKCSIGPENYRSFLSDIVSPNPGAAQRTFPLSVVKKLKLSRLSPTQLEGLLSCVKDFHGLTAFDMHIVDWVVSPSSRRELASMKWVTKLHISCVGFSSLGDFTDLLSALPALEQLKVYMPHVDPTSALAPREQDTWDGLPSRKLAQLQLLDIVPEFMGCLVSLFTAQRLVILSALWPGTWDMLKRMAGAVKELEFSNCQDVIGDQIFLNVPSPLQVPQSIRYRYVVEADTDTQEHFYIPTIIDSFSQDPFSPLPTTITISFEYKILLTASENIVETLCEAPWPELDEVLSSRRCDHLNLEFNLDLDVGVEDHREYCDRIKDRIFPQMHSLTERGALSVSFPDA